jgi:sugar/nucleoside kinase (ribokinase family)
MYNICCVGHITLDKVVTPQAERFMAGGTSFYFSNAVRNMDVQYILVTSLAESEIHFVTDLRNKGIRVNATACEHTVYFENSYSQNQDHRTQRVLQMAAPFTAAQLQNINAAVYHLGPLLANDIPLNLIKLLAKKGKVSLDVQGYLRKVENYNVCPIDWGDKKEALQYVHILKANEMEMEVLTGHSNVHKAALLLNEWGVKEVVITLGSLGSVIYADGVFYDIPAYIPASVTDATGCGDTYMAGYLYQRAKGSNIQEAGEFAAAIASLKIATAGPFTGTKEDVFTLLEECKAK